MSPKPGILDRLLRPFGDVRAGEAASALLLLLNLFLLFLGYYLLKSVREAIVGGAELKSYASAVQAALLMGFVPLYSWFASRVDRMKLILGFLLFFVVNIELFYLGALAEIPHLGFAFFVWLGIFNVAAPAQFWSFSNDIYNKSVGDRLFPIIAIGAVAGAPIGSLVAKLLFEGGVSPYLMMQLTVVILLIHLGLYFMINSRETRKAEDPSLAQEKLTGANGFMLVLKSPYIRLMALLLILLNFVNTTGEYILTKAVNQMALAAAGEQGLAEGTKAFTEFIENYRGSFFSGFFLAVNITAFCLQALVVSRIVKYIGIKGVLFMLPLVAFGAYGLIALGAGFTVIRWAKTAENSTDYSVMNTAKAMLWLPTTRQEKYKAKQAVDTFFVRIGDLLSGGLVFLGAAVLHFSVQWFAVINLVLVAVWLAVSVLVLHHNRRLAARVEEVQG
jgi:AAA family ATP:ADP antiporter